MNSKLVFIAIAIFAAFGLSIATPVLAQNPIKFFTNNERRRKPKRIRHYKWASEAFTGAERGWRSQSGRWGKWTASIRNSKAWIGKNLRK